MVCQGCHHRAKPRQARGVEEVRLVAARPQEPVLVRDVFLAYRALEREPGIRSGAWHRGLREGVRRLRASVCRSVRHVVVRRGLLRQCHVEPGRERPEEPLPRIDFGRPRGVWDFLVVELKRRGPEDTLERVGIPAVVLQLLLARARAQEEAHGG